MHLEKGHIHVALIIIALFVVVSGAYYLGRIQNPNDPSDQYFTISN